MAEIGIGIYTGSIQYCTRCSMPLSKSKVIIAGKIEESEKEGGKSDVAFCGEYCYKMLQVEKRITVISPMPMILAT